jgi:hypothetical protein
MAAHQVKKDGPNKGRSFLTCPVFRTFNEETSKWEGGCGEFYWLAKTA